MAKRRFVEKGKETLYDKEIEFRTERELADSVDKADSQRETEGLV